MGEKWYYKSKEEGLTRKLRDGITAHIFSGERIMISLAEVAPHTVSTAHSHPEEQWGCLLEGECIRIQNGEEVSMKKGDLWRTPPNTPHSVRTGESAALIMDIFSPPRQAYTKPGEGFAATVHSESSK
jgi:quercetin dioxygenase-like cupin family protein